MESSSGSENSGNSSATQEENSKMSDDSKTYNSSKQTSSINNETANEISDQTIKNKSSPKNPSSDQSLDPNSYSHKELQMNS